MRSLILAAVLLGFASVVVTADGSCHNSTGTCLKDGFHCANKEIVSYAKRCDGVEDCLDGTDEYMCHVDGAVPLHEISHEKREMMMQGSCARCDCLNNVMTITENDAWWQAALEAPTDTQLMTGSGRTCGKSCVRKITLAFYKKSGVCRGWLCCVRQRDCPQCKDPAVVGSCTDANVANRCIVPGS